MSILAMLEEMPVFGEFNKMTNTPTVLFDPKELINTVGLLWENACKQRLLMEAMEAEMAKRKTETEVRLRTMQNDLEGLIKNEAKKRESEDEGIRADMAKLKMQLAQDLKAMTDETLQREDDLERRVDRTTGAIKASVLETQGKVSDLAVDVDELRKALDALNSKQATVDLSGVLKTMNEKHSQLCSFIGTTPEGVVTAVKSSKEKESFLRVPALQDLASRIKTAESVANAAINDVRQLDVTVKDISQTVKDVKDEVTSVKQSLKETEVRVTDGYLDGDRKLHKRIDDLSSRLVAPTPSSGGQVTTVDLSGPAISQLRDELADLAKRVRRNEADILEKASIETVNGKVDRSDLDAIWDALNKLRGVVESHGADIAALLARPQQIAHTPQTPRPIIEPSPPREDPRIAEILSRLADAEKMLKHLDNIKADKDEVNAALKDLMKRVEKALNALLARIQFLENNAMPNDATAGRFRCLSCNRNAGPLQEQLHERMSSQQFPPSNVFVQGQRPQSARPSSATIPGMRDYGGGLTSSRKKLMNYYTWLQDRADSPSQTPEHPNERSKSPALKHPWTGAQSGNGMAGERQCGDHGSLEPEAIGSDGKFYVGVHSRPQSATRRVD